MKPIRKLSLILFLFFGLQLRAQEVWLSIGTNFNHFKPVLESANSQLYPTQDIYMGTLIGIPLNDRFFLQTGLAFSGKSFRYQTRSSALNSAGEDFLLFTELPLHFQYRVPVYNDLKVFFGAGGFLAYDFLGSAFRDKRIGDLGFSGSTGLVYRWLQVSAHYDLGLARIDVNEDLPVRSRTLGLRLSVDAIYLLRSFMKI